MFGFGKKKDNQKDAASNNNASLNGKKILVTEDEQDLREVLVDKLTEEGFRVLEAVNGDQCIEIALKEHPDLILLDLYMPKSTGFDVLDTLIGDPWGKNAKVIVLTNRGDFTSKRKVYTLKHVSYLIKAETGLDTLVDEVRKKLTLVDDEDTL